MTYGLSDSDIAFLKNNNQRYKLHLAFTDTFQLTATSISGESDGWQYKDELIWRPNILMGGSRLAFTGQPIYFNAGRSHTRNSGWIIQSNAASYYHWDMGDGTTYEGATGNDMPKNTYSWGGNYFDYPFAIKHAYQSTGLYNVTLTLTFDGYTESTQRWVRVLSPGDEMVRLLEVSVSDSLERGGAEMRCRVSGNTHYVQGYMNCLLYVEDLWGIDQEHFQEQTVSYAVGPSDPHILFQGFVVGGSIKEDPESGDFTFLARTAEWQFQQAMVYATDFWDDEAKGYGHYIAGMTMVDAMYHMVAEHTNFTERFDASLWPHDDLSTNHLGSLTFNEGSLWEGFNDCAKNVFAYMVGDINGFSYIPNPQLSWLTNQMPALCFDEDLLLEAEIEELAPDPVNFVELNATTSNKGALQARHPSTPTGLGAWEIRHGILTDSQTLLDALALGVYNWRRAPYRLRLRCPLNHAARVGHVVCVELESSSTTYILYYNVPRVSLGQTATAQEMFLVKETRWQPDLDRGTFVCTYELEQIGDKTWNSVTGALT